MSLQDIETERIAMDSSINNRVAFDAYDRMLVPDSHMSGLDFWDPQIFSNMAIGAPSLRNPSIDSRLADLQDIQEFAATAQELPSSFSDQNPTTQPNQDLTIQHTYTVLPSEQPSISTNDFQEANAPQSGYIHNENEALNEVLHKIKLELSALREDLRKVNLRVVTVNENHKSLVIWTVNTNSTLNAISRWLSDNVGADVVMLENVPLPVDNDSF